MSKEERAAVKADLLKDDGGEKLTRSMSFQEGMDRNSVQGQDNNKRQRQAEDLLTLQGFAALALKAADKADFGGMFGSREEALAIAEAAEVMGDIAAVVQFPAAVLKYWNQGQYAESIKLALQTEGMEDIKADAKEILVSAQKEAGYQQNRAVGGAGAAAVGLGLAAGAAAAAPPLAAVLAAAGVIWTVGKGAEAMYDWWRTGGKVFGWWANASKQKECNKDAQMLIMDAHGGGPDKGNPQIIRFLLEQGIVGSKDELHEQESRVKAAASLAKKMANWNDRAGKIFKEGGGEPTDMMQR